MNWPFLHHSSHIGFIRQKSAFSAYKPSLQLNDCENIHADDLSENATYQIIHPISTFLTAEGRELVAEKHLPKSKSCREKAERTADKSIDLNQEKRLLKNERNRRYRKEVKEKEEERRKRKEELEMENFHLRVQISHLNTCLRQMQPTQEKNK